MIESIFSSPSAWGLFILRLAAGITFIVHGWLKVNPNGPTKGPAGFAGWLKQMGVPLPLFFAWLVALLETVGAVLFILGLGTQILATGFAIDMAVATLLVKRQMMNANFMDQKVQGWEFEFALLAQSLTILFTGAGSLSLDYVLGLGLPSSITFALGILTLVAIGGIVVVLSARRQPAATNQPKAA